MCGVLASSEPLPGQWRCPAPRSSWPRLGGGPGRFCWDVCGWQVESPASALSSRPARTSWMSSPATPSRPPRSPPGGSSDWWRSWQWQEIPSAELRSEECEWHWVTSWQPQPHPGGNCIPRPAGGCPRVFCSDSSMIIIDNSNTKLHDLLVFARFWLTYFGAVLAMLTVEDVRLPEQVTLAGGLLLPTRDRDKVEE